MTETQSVRTARTTQKQKIDTPARRQKIYLQTRLITAGLTIRATLAPLWARIHASDLRFGLVDAIPDIASTAMCRHSALFAARALSSAFDAPSLSIRPHAGSFTPAPGDIIPGYAARKANIEHAWVEIIGVDEDIIWLDITADQFGREPVLAAAASNTLFTSHHAGERPARGGLHHTFRGIVPTIRNWEGDPKGTWWDDDLAELRGAHEALVADLRAILDPKASTAQTIEKDT